MNLEMFIHRLEELNPKYLSNSKIVEAYNFAVEAHTGQFRKSGERYVSHPIQVALILAELELDVDTIIAGLLHDVIEDTKYTYKDIEKMFSRDVAEIVEGVTKLGKMNFETKEIQQAENFRKMLFAMSKDVRVILVKLADRLHNMRTLKYMSSSSKAEKADETLEIFAPIAHRLGIFKIKWEMEDLALLYKEPDKYYEIVNMVNKKREEREEIIGSVIHTISKKLSDSDIHHEIYGRPKNFYSIYKKMAQQNKSFDEIHDITAIRVIVDSVRDCYGVLGLVHETWTPIPRRFKDYIAMPKPNMYQSLHTTVIGEFGEPFEIQIRTKEMHRIAEYGIAAHWKYKENVSSDKLGEGLSWIRQMMEWQKDLQSPEEFLENVKLDLFENHVYVFTPNGKVIELPFGSTPVDFAYKIHSGVGNGCVGSKVNNKIVPLNYELKMGDIVEILTSKNSPGPSRDWLKFVKSSNAKSRIKSFFKKERKDENIEKGRELLERELKKHRIDLKDALKPEIIESIIKRQSLKSLDDLLAAIGYGGITLHQIIPRIREKLTVEEEPSQLEINIGEQPQKKVSDKGVAVKGIDDILIRYAKCCNPVPGDEIIGFITRGKGVTVHRADCTNFSNDINMKDRFIDVQWTGNHDGMFASKLQIIANDRNGLLGEVTNIIQNTHLNVKGLSARVSNDFVATIDLSIEIKSKSELESLINRIKSLQGIMEVIRTIS